MKSYIVLFFLFGSIVVSGQARGYKISLAKDVTLDFRVMDFFESRHTIDTCTDEFHNRYICHIDGKQWFGSDRSLELPRTELVSMTLTNKGKSISLDVSGMYNPDPVNRKSIEWVEEDKNYFLSMMFSDGAGAYIAKWRIAKGKSERILISNNEIDFGN